MCGVWCASCAQPYRYKIYAQQRSGTYLVDRIFKQQYCGKNSIFSLDGSRVSVCAVVSHMIVHNRNASADVWSSGQKIQPFAFPQIQSTSETSRRRVTTRDDAWRRWRISDPVEMLTTEKASGTRDRVVRVVSSTRSTCSFHTAPITGPIPITNRDVTQLIFFWI
jgi:hypothetical protein